MDELAFLRETIQSAGPIRTDDDYWLVSGIMSCFQWLYDPSNIPYVIPYLHKGSGRIAADAIWTLCWLGAAEQHKDYMIGAVEPGLPWDTEHELEFIVPRAIGHHLKTARDRDLAQLLIRWRPRPYGDPFNASAPFGKTAERVRHLGSRTGIGMGYAVGADPYALTEDQDLVDASVARFVTERQDG